MEKIIYVLKPWPIFHFLATRLSENINNLSFSAKGDYGLRLGINMRPESHQALLTILF
jgi:hypothetical protein